MKNMKYWTMNSAGRDKLSLQTQTLTAPGPNEVRVRVNAVALNYRDKLIIEGAMPAVFPLTPASDMAGVVEAVGDNVSQFTPGDRVISSFFPDWIEGKRPGSAGKPHGAALGGSYPGMLAQQIVVNENWLVASPESLSDVEASTLPCAGLTAWFALVEQGQLKAGDSVLVQGTGGVALFALQIAKAQGATVYVTSSGEDKLDSAKALGADFGINRLQGDWVEQVLELSHHRGIDHVVDTVGGSNVARSVAVVAPGGRVSLIGVLEGTDIVVPGGLMLMKSAVIQGIGVGHRRALADLVHAVDATRIKPVIDSTWTLEQLPEALARLDSGPFGKIVVTL
ncbi:NAD(P)-dependent alcohol dehydrogenase [Enterobacter soli]|uniref:zinc-dependent alcohol dehydrogenase family protein n=1 Tax=Enterobacter soli TaxID=885040 RepID=UPI0028A015A5|nr:NAD(P)-dependent alcohol dehydrogenase [Enterobacter soli]